MTQPADGSASLCSRKRRESVSASRKHQNWSWPRSSPTPSSTSSSAATPPPRSSTWSRNRLQGRRAQRPLRRLLAAVRGPRRRNRRARAPPLHEAQDRVRRRTIRNLTLPCHPSAKRRTRRSSRNAPPRASSGTPLAASGTAVRAVRTSAADDPFIARILENIQRVVGALIRYEDYSSSSPFALELALDSLWIHPADSTTATTGPRPFAHRECLVCALCAYVLQGSQLPPTPTHSTLNGAELRARLESTSLPADAPAAMRAAHFRCCVEPLSFAVELCSKNIGTAEQLPQHLACLETGRIQLQLQLSEYAHLSAMRASSARSTSSSTAATGRARPPPRRPRASGGGTRSARCAGGAPRARADTRASVKRRGATRRGFVTNQCLRKGGVKGLSEGERVSPASSPTASTPRASRCTSSSPRRPSPARRIRRAAFPAAVVGLRLRGAHRAEDGIERRAARRLRRDPRRRRREAGLHERLAPRPTPRRRGHLHAPRAAGLTPPLKLQATLANVGLNAGVSVGAYDADVFAEGFSMTLVRPAAAGGPVPLVAPAPEGARRRAAGAARPRRRQPWRLRRGGFAGGARALRTRRRRPRQGEMAGRGALAVGRRGRGRGGAPRRARSRCSGSRRSGSTSPTTRRPPSRCAPPRRRALRRRRRRPRRLRPLRRGDAAPKGKKGRKGAARSRRRRPPRGDAALGGGVGDAAGPRPPQRWRRVAVPSRALALTADRAGVSGGVGADAAGASRRSSCRSSSRPSSRVSRASAAGSCALRSSTRRSSAARRATSPRRARSRRRPRGAADGAAALARGGGDDRDVPQERREL